MRLNIKSCIFHFLLSAAKHESEPRPASEKSPTKPSKPIRKKSEVPVNAVVGKFCYFTCSVFIIFINYTGVLPAVLPIRRTTHLSLLLKYG